MLDRACHGVYLLAGRLRDWRCELWIALLAAGPGSFACWRAAGCLWQLDGMPPDALDVGVDMARRPRRPGVHRLSLRDGDLVAVDGIPCTSAVRTLLDLGAVVDESVVERSLESALRRRLVGDSVLPDLAVRAGSRHSVSGSRLGHVLARRPAGTVPTGSDAETLFVQVVRRMAFPDPARQQTVILRGRTYRLDFAWPALRLAVEIDGAFVHGPDRLTADLHRQNQVLLDGWLILRFSWFMVVRQPAMVERDMRDAWALRSMVVRGA